MVEDRNIQLQVRLADVVLPTAMLVRSLEWAIKSGERDKSRESGEGDWQKVAYGRGDGLMVSLVQHWTVWAPTRPLGFPQTVVKPNFKRCYRIGHGILEESQSDCYF